METNGRRENGRRNRQHVGNEVMEKKKDNWSKWAAVDDD